MLYVNNKRLTVIDGLNSTNIENISEDATFSKIIINDNNSTLELVTPPYNSDYLLLAVGSFDIQFDSQDKNNFTIKVKGPENKEDIGIAILYIKEGTYTSGNRFIIDTDNNAYLFIYSENDIQIKLMNSGQLKNTYIYLPEGELIAKNRLTLEGSIFAKSLTVGNNTKLRQVDPPDKFQNLVQDFVNLEIQFDNPIKDFKLLRWNK